MYWYRIFYQGEMVHRVLARSYTLAIKQAKSDLAGRINPNFLKLYGLTARI